MVSIKSSEVKNFLSKSKGIKSGNLLPVLSYVKLECLGGKATITKSNLKSFIIYDIEAEFKKDFGCLIPEKTLTGVVNFGEGEVLSISIEKTNVVIDDGYSQTKFQNIDPKTYPSVPLDIKTEKQTYDTDIISYLSLAKEHAAPPIDTHIHDWKSYVHLQKIDNKLWVVGTDGTVAYFKKVKGRFSPASFDPETLSLVCGLQSFDYSENEKYQFFDSVGVTYGFIKSEVAFPDISPILKKLVSDKGFTINRKLLMNFCKKVEYINDTAVPPEVSFVNDGKSSVLIKYVDISGNNSALETVSVKDKTYTINETIFQPKKMLTVISGIDAEEIRISQITGNMIITTAEDKDYIGVVMELLKQENVQGNEKK